MHGCILIGQKLTVEQKLINAHLERPMGGCSSLIEVTTQVNLTTVDLEIFVLK